MENLDHTLPLNMLTGSACTASADISAIVGEMSLSIFMVLKVTVHWSPFAQNRVLGAIGKKVGGHQQEQLNMIDALAKGKGIMKVNTEPSTRPTYSTLCNITAKKLAGSGTKFGSELCPGIDSLTGG